MLACIIATTDDFHLRFIKCDTISKIPWRYNIKMSPKIFWYQISDTWRCLIVKIWWFTREARVFSREKTTRYAQRIWKLHARYTRLMIYVCLIYPFYWPTLSYANQCRLILELRPEVSRTAIFAGYAGAMRFYRTAVASGTIHYELVSHDKKEQRPPDDVYRSMLLYFNRWLKLSGVDCTQGRIDTCCHVFGTLQRSHEHFSR